MLAHEAWLASRVAPHAGGDRGGGAEAGLVRVHDGRRARRLLPVFDWHGAARSNSCWPTAGASRWPNRRARRSRCARRSAGCTGMASSTAISSRPTCTSAKTACGASSTWARRVRQRAEGAARAACRHAQLHEPRAMGARRPCAGRRRQRPVRARRHAYQWLTGRLPYGEIEPYQTGRYRRDPAAPSRLRPDVPVWLDHSC